MHKDMHYAGTYALAKLAGLNDAAALQIGGAAQFVDDSFDDTAFLDEKTGEMFVSEVSTRYAGYNPLKYANERSALTNYIDQLAVWVPFHFLPGGQGDTLTQKLVCQTDSAIAQEMIASHLRKAVNLKKLNHKWGAHLIGVAAHVYADTFAHYGFSGVSSRRNLVAANTIREVRDDGSDGEDWKDTVIKFRDKWGYDFVSNIKNFLVNIGGELSTWTENGAMGHPGVGSMPDLPYLRYSFQYERGDLLYGGQPDIPRNNRETYLQACEKLHRYFSDYLAQSGEEADENARRDFSQVKEQIDGILSERESDKDARLRHWRTKAKELWDITIPEYPGEKWAERFKGSSDREDALGSDAYLFFMAAAWHKKTVLNDILPKHGINIECRQFRNLAGFAPESA